MLHYSRSYNVYHTYMCNFRNQHLRILLKCFGTLFSKFSTEFPVESIVYVFMYLCTNSCFSYKYIYTHNFVKTSFFYLYSSPALIYKISCAFSYNLIRCICFIRVWTMNFYFLFYFNNATYKFDFYVEK